MDRDLSTGSREVARAAIMIAMTQSREEEQQCRKKLEESEIRSAAADFGGDFLSGMVRIIERAVVAKREGLIAEEHEEGCVAGAAREALSQISSKALGMSVGGKIGVARCGGDMAVALFFGVGLGHLDEICIGLAHRAI